MTLVPRGHTEATLGGVQTHVPGSVRLNNGEGLLQHWFGRAIGVQDFFGSVWQRRPLVVAHTHAPGIFAGLLPFPAIRAQVREGLEYQTELDVVNYDGRARAPLQQAVQGRPCRHADLARDSWCRWAVRSWPWLPVQSTSLHYTECTRCTDRQPSGPAGAHHLQHERRRRGWHCGRVRGLGAVLAGVLPAAAAPAALAR